MRIPELFSKPINIDGIHADLLLPESEHEESRKEGESVNDIDRPEPESPNPPNSN